MITELTHLLYGVEQHKPKCLPYPSTGSKQVLKVSFTVGLMKSICSTELSRPNNYNQYVVHCGINYTERQASFWPVRKSRFRRNNLLPAENSLSESTPRPLNNGSRIHMFTGGAQSTGEARYLYQPLS